MKNYNKSFAKIVNRTSGTIEYGPIPLTVIEHHHEEWDEPVIDPETGEPTGKTEHMSRDWVTIRIAIYPTAADYLLMGYLRVVDKLPEAPASEGYHWEPSGWDDSSGENIVRLYEAVKDPPPPPRTFSKLYLYVALVRMGKWDVLVEWLKGQTMPDGVNAFTAFNNAVDISEGHPLFNAWFSSVKEALGVDDATAEMVLEASVKRDE